MKRVPWPSRSIGLSRGTIRFHGIAQALFQVVIDLFSFLFLFARPQSRLSAENIFLRKQLAFYKERVSPNLYMWNGIDLTAIKKVVSRPVLNGFHHD